MWINPDTTSGIVTMRKLLLASTAILIASYAPSQARDYNSCSTAISGPATPDCSFASYTPRRTAASGPRRFDDRYTYDINGDRYYHGQPHDYDFWHDNPHGWNFWH
jgi:hypothetical protein